MIDYHRGTIPLALVESVELFDDFIVCFYLNHQQIIARMRSSHKSDDMAALQTVAIQR